MSVYDQRPWLARYSPGMPADITIEHASALAMWRSAAARSPDATFLRYFDATFTMRQVDEISDALAAGLVDRGFARGDRLGVYLQNVPAFVFCMLAAWKAGGVMVSINPMNKERELRTLLDDSGATALVCHPDLYAKVASRVVPDTEVKTVVVASELDYQTRDDPRAFDGVTRSRPEGTFDLSALVARYQGHRLDDPGLGPDDVAFLTYTSGTTGPSKGAMATHANVVFNAQSYRDWVGLSPDDVVLGVAPLFHITGLVGHVAVAMLLPATLVLAYRFEPAMILDTIRETRPTFGVHLVAEHAWDRPGRPGVTDQGVFGRGAHRAEHRRGIPGPARAVYPQHLRPHRDHVPFARRALRRPCSGRSEVGGLVGRGPDLQHGGAGGGRGWRRPACR
jgi:long-chain acyl-CoA synthetase